MIKYSNSQASSALRFGLVLDALHTAVDYTAFSSLSLSELLTVTFLEADTNVLCMYSPLRPTGLQTVFH